MDGAIARGEWRKVATRVVGRVLRTEDDIGMGVRDGVREKL